MSNNTVTFTAFLKDMFSSQLGKLQAKSDATFNKINKDVDKISGTGKQAAFSIRQLDEQISKLEESRAISIDTKYIKQAGKEITKLELQKNKLLGNRSDSGSGFGDMLGAGIGAYAMYQFGKNVTSLIADKEKTQAVLSTAFDSQYAGSKAMDDLDKFGLTAPFKLDDIESAFEQLSIHGFKPTMTDMKKMGDLSASTGKTISEYAEAIFSAQMGMFRPLKQFGIKAKQDGDMIAFTFKGITTEVKNTEDAIEKYMVSLGDTKGVMGSMEAQADKLGGGLTRLSNNWTQFKENLGKSHGVLSTTIDKLSSMLGYINDISDKNIDKAERGLPGVQTLTGYGSFETISNGIGDVILNKTGLWKSNPWSKSLDLAKEGEVANTKIDKYMELFDKEGTTRSDLIKGEKELLTYLGKEFGADVQQKFRKEYQDAFKLWSEKDKKDPASSSTSSTTDLNSGVSNVSGNASVKNIYITVTKMVGVETLSTTTLTESEVDIGAALDKVLLTALNDANRIAE